MRILDETEIYSKGGSYPNVKLQFVYKSPKRLSSIFKIKDLLPSLVCSNVIYKYSCSGCSATYYGKTSRNLKIRCCEHLGTNKSGGKRACPSSSSVGDHVKQSGHEGTLEDFSIISKTSMTFDFHIHESLLIQRDRPTLNSQQSSISMVLLSDLCSTYSISIHFLVPILSLVICLLFVIIFAMYLLHVVYHYIFQCSLYVLFFCIFPIRPFPSRGF